MRYALIGLSLAALASNAAAVPVTFQWNSCYRCQWRVES